MTEYDKWCQETQARAQAWAGEEAAFWRSVSVIWAKAISLCVAVIAATVVVVEALK